ncbi:MAG: hypothetical protein K6G68_11300 [Oscillospiraceae bacterium]|nr:hypothetical protein [Oscillospiraceae bacterium]
MLYTTDTVQHQNNKAAEEIIAADISVSKSTGEYITSNNDLERELEKINSALEKHTLYAGRSDYALAVFSGIFAGIVDSIYVGEIKISKNDIGISHKQVNNFIENYAESRGIKGQHLKDTIANLEKEFTVAQDNVWSGADIGVSAKNHHLADLAHHPTPLGLVSALMVQFLRIGTFVNKDGEWHFIFVETTKDDIIAIVIPALITGVLNWLALLAEKKYEDDADTEIPGALKTLIHIIASSPMIIEVIKMCR